MSTSKGSKRKFTEPNKDDVQNLLNKMSERITMVDMKKNSKFNCFKRIRIDEDDTCYVTCSKCNDNNLIKYNHHGSNGLDYHLSKHKTKSDTMVPSVSAFMTKPCSKSDKEKVSKAAAKMCAIDMRPFYMIEGDGMSMFIDTIIKIIAVKGRIDAKDLLPCADTVKNHVVSMAKEGRSVLKEILSTVPYINCTTDHWYESYNNVDYMTITIHYLDPSSLTLKNRVIGTFEVNDKTSKLTEEQFKKKLTEFDVLHKVRIVVTDNAMSMQSAFRSYDWIGCCAHDMALVQKYAFNQQESVEEPDPVPSISLLMKSAKDLVTRVKRSTISVALETKLRQSCETRWDTNYDMLKSISDNIMSLDAEKSLESYMSNINRGLLTEVCDLMKQFKIIRESLCADNRPTLHTVLLSYHILRQHSISKLADSGPIKVLKGRMKKYLDQKFHLTPMHIIATFLHPKYRSTGTSNKDLEKRSDDRLRSLLEEQEESDDENVSKVPYYDAEPDSIDKLFVDFAEKPIPTSRQSNEIDSYKREKFSASELNSCPFKFWMERKEKYPKLSAIAMWLLSCPATSCSSERNFSAAGFLTDHRNRLNPNTIDDILFLKSNQDLLDEKSEK